MKISFSRRQVLAQAGAAGLGLATMQLSSARGASVKNSPDSKDTVEPFRYCLNTSTIREQKLSLVEVVDVAARAGYHGIEPWIREIQRFAEQGNSLEDLGKRIVDAGLTVESAIGFAPWIVNDENARKAGLEQAKRDMELVRSIGGKRIAAPPVGATREANVNLLDAANRYRTLLELGAEMGVTPQLEVWGFSKTLSRLGEVMFVAVESGHRNACLLPDIYHIYKGGSDFGGLRLIDGAAIHVFHVNDYPAQPHRDKLNDADRVYPGDGAAPLGDILQTLYATGFRGALSLELFNPEYWKQDALTVARTGLEKTRAAVRSAMTPHKPAG